MSVSIESNSLQGIGSLIMQQLLAESGTSSSSGGSSALGDLVSISSTGQQLAQGSAAAAMSDLFSTQKDVQGDLAQLKSYFQQNPQGLASVLSRLQGATGTYSASGVLAGSSDGSSLMSVLLASRNQGSLFDVMADSGATSSSSSLSLLG